MLVPKNMLLLPKLASWIQDHAWPSIVIRTFHLFSDDFILVPRRMGAIMRAVLLSAFFYGVAVGAQAPSPPVTTGILQKVAGSLEMYVDKLPKMPTIHGYKLVGGKPVPNPLTIGMYAKKWKFHRDLPATPVFVYGTSAAAATFPGPTIVARQDVPLPITWENHLPKSHILPWDPTIAVALPASGGVPTVVHLHGSAHPPRSDGSAFAWFTAGFAEKGPAWSQTTYTYPNVQPPGNLWYHDHALGLTRVNLLAGLLGAYLIHKPEIDDVLDLPENDCDHHLIIADRSFNVDGSLYMNATGVAPELHPQWRPEYFGEAMTANGKAWPYLDVTQRRHRFRILNACNSRYLRLSLTGGLPMYVVGSDGSYLSAPVRQTSVLLSPAEIADVVVDFTRTNVGEAVELTNDAPYPFPTGAPAGALHRKVMRFNVVGKGRDEKPDRSRIPAKEVPYAIVTNDTVFTRYLTLYEYLTPSGQSKHLYINGLRLTDPATETPKTGTSELWNVINLTVDNHPMHIHLGMFQAVKVQEILDLETFKSCMTAINDAVKCNIAGHATGKILPVPDHEKTWKNTIKIEPGYMTSIVIKFRIVDNNLTYPFDATAEPGYVYHCHILDHEDNEMIRPLKLRAA